MNSPGVYTLRRGRTLNDSPYGEVSYVREASCSGDKQEWCPHEGKWLEGYTSGNAVNNISVLFPIIMILKLSLKYPRVTWELT